MKLVRDERCAWLNNDAAVGKWSSRHQKEEEEEEKKEAETKTSCATPAVSFRSYSSSLSLCPLTRAFTRTSVLLWSPSFSMRNTKSFPKQRHTCSRAHHQTITQKRRPKEIALHSSSVNATAARVRGGFTFRLSRSVRGAQLL